MIRLHLFWSFVVYTLLYECDSSRLTNAVLEKLSGACARMVSQINGKSIAEEAHDPSVSAIARMG